jgi:hypothetical protein
MRVRPSLRGRRSALTGALAVALAVPFALACQTEPVYEVDRAIVPSEPGWGLDDMTNAIQRAGARRGWDMRVDAPGEIEGRLRKPSAKAVVDIHYTSNEFSIRYKSSENLGYQGGRIHNNYNRWVYNLEGDIRREFLRLRPSTPRKE